MSQGEPVRGEQSILFAEGKMGWLGLFQLSWEGERVTAAL